MRIVGTALLMAMIYLHIVNTSSAGSAVEVDLELVLAADISDSMDQDERRLQRAGYALAFRDQSVTNAITSGIYGRVAVTFVEWADLAQPRVVVPWQIIDGPEAANSFADLLDDSAIGRKGRTSISGALSFGAHLIENNAIDGIRRVIDVSGDGPNNQGASVLATRDDIIARGIVINGLPLMINVEGPRGPFDTGFDKRKLDIYYEDCVIGGPGAFMVPIRSRDGLIEGIRQKLYLEIAGDIPTFIPAAWPAPPRLPC